MDGSSPVTLVYTGEDGTEAVLTYKLHNIYGRVKLSDDRNFIIESVSDGVVWVQIGMLS